MRIAFLALAALCFFFNEFGAGLVAIAVVVFMPEGE